MFRTLVQLALLSGTGVVFAQNSCPREGDLEPPYCDADWNLVADTPTDPAQLRVPSTLVFSYTPVEEPAVYEKVFRPFTQYLSQCLRTRVVYYQVQSNVAEIEAMRTGRLHVAGFSTGATAFAVNIAGAVPFAVKGYADHSQGYHLLVIVRKDSRYRKLADLKGRKVAHTSPSSNSGHMAPLALFPKNGLVPDKDYKVVFSGKHDLSILGVRDGDFDAAAVASDVFDRLVRRGEIKAEDFRVIYQSEPFPTSAFAYAHNLEPTYRDRMLKCFAAFRFPPEMSRVFDGADRFVPITYLKAYAVVREVAASAGEHFNRMTYDRETARTTP